MRSSVRVARLAAGDVFKLIGIGLVCSLVPLGALTGVLSMLGVATVKWGEQTLTGWTAVLAAPFIGFFCALLFTAFVGAAVWAGLWLFSKFRPLTLHYDSADAA
jgi:hypothetical protein